MPPLNRPPLHGGKRTNLVVDEHSRTSTDGTVRSGATPTSILMAAPELTRDLSDLSGSYLHGNPAPRSHRGAVPSSVYSAEPSLDSIQREWRLAHFLSHRPTSATIPGPPGPDLNTILVEQSGIIEVVRRDDDLSIKDHVREPIVILLMDPGKKIYELMQLWIDPSMDNVRSVLQSVQQKLADKRWRQDYDGLFQVRGENFTQLIHILNVSKYDVQPYELWIGKPWSMSAKST